MCIWVYFYCFSTSLPQCEHFSSAFAVAASVSVQLSRHLVVVCCCLCCCCCCCCPCYSSCCCCWRGNVIGLADSLTQCATFPLQLQLHSNSNEISSHFVLSHDITYTQCVRVCVCDKSMDTLQTVYSIYICYMAHTRFHYRYLCSTTYISV